MKKQVVNDVSKHCMHTANLYTNDDGQITHKIRIEIDDTRIIKRHSTVYSVKNWENGLKKIFRYSSIKGTYVYRERVFK